MKIAWVRLKWWEVLLGAVGWIIAIAGVVIPAWLVAPLVWSALNEVSMAAFCVAVVALACFLWARKY